MQPLQQISFMVPALVAKNLAKRAAPLNIRPTEYAKRLFEAAYFVRCLAEKGEAAEDVELDRQVRQVFLLADCEPEYIAETIGMPVERAQRILDGWRQAAQELVSGDAPRRITGGGKASPTATENGVTSGKTAPSPLPPRSRRRRNSPHRGLYGGGSGGDQKPVARRQERSGHRRRSRLRAEAHRQFHEPPSRYLPGEVA